MSHKMPDKIRLQKEKKKKKQVTNTIKATT